MDSSGLLYHRKILYHLNHDGSPLLIYKNDCVNPWNLIRLQTLPTAFFVSQPPYLNSHVLSNFPAVLIVPGSVLAQTLVKLNDEQHLKGFCFVWFWFSLYV